MAKLNGCYMPDDWVCELCDKHNMSVNDLTWHKVHDHPDLLVCTSCQKVMDTWEPLGDDDTSEFKEEKPTRVPIRKKKPKVITAPGVPPTVLGEEPEPEIEPEGEAEISFNSEFTLDDM